MTSRDGSILEYFLVYEFIKILVLKSVISEHNLTVAFQPKYISIIFNVKWTKYGYKFYAAENC